MKDFKLDSKCQYYSFQKDLTDEEKKQLKKHHITDIGSGFSDFLDTASAMKNLDLLISVDTATAHLGGALGVNTFILLTSIQVEWRWGVANEHQSSHWYESVKLIWQKKKRIWSSAFKELNELTQDYIEKKSK